MCEDFDTSILLFICMCLNFKIKKVINDEKQELITLKSRNFEYFIFIPRIIENICEWTHNPAQDVANENKTRLFLYFEIETHALVTSKTIKGKHLESEFPKFSLIIKYSRKRKILSFSIKEKNTPNIITKAHIFNIAIHEHSQDDTRASPIKIW